MSSLPIWAKEARERRKNDNDWHLWLMSVEENQDKLERALEIALAALKAGCCCVDTDTKRVWCDECLAIKEIEGL